MSPSNLYNYKNFQEVIDDFKTLRYEYRNIVVRCAEAGIPTTNTQLAHIYNDLVILGDMLERNGYNLDDL